MVVSRGTIGQVLVVAIAVATVLAASLRAQDTPGRVDVGSLTIRDSEGIVRIELGLDDREMPYFSMRDDKGHLRLTAALTPKGGPAFAVFDSTGKLRTAINEQTVSVCDSHQRVRGVLFVDPTTDSAALAFRDAEGKELWRRP